MYRVTLRGPNGSPIVVRVNAASSFAARVKAELAHPFFSFEHAEPVA